MHVDHRDHLAPEIDHALDHRIGIENPRRFFIADNLLHQHNINPVLLIANLKGDKLVLGGVDVGFLVNCA